MRKMMPSTRAIVDSGGQDQAQKKRKVCGALVQLLCCVIMVVV